MRIPRPTNCLLILLVIVTANLSAAPSFQGSVQLELNPNPAAPLAGILSFEASDPVKTTINGRSGEHSFSITYGPEKDPSEGLPVVGMYADRTYNLFVEISDDSGRSKYEGNLTLSTPALPDRPELMPRIVAEIIDGEAMANGYTLFNPRRRVPLAVADAITDESRFNMEFGMLAVVDAEGEVIWYYHADSRITDYRPIANGNIMFITSDNRLIEIDALGNTIASWVASRRPDGPDTTGAIPVDVPTFHHSFQEYPNGDLLILSTEIRILPGYFTSETKKNAARGSVQVVGDVVIRMNRQGEILWKWKAFDHLDPYQIGYLTFSNYWVRRGFPNTADWSHANAVRIVDDGDAFLVNFRLISGIAKIDADSQEIEWLVITDPKDMKKDLQDKTFELKGGGEWFWMPHAPWITEEGNLLIFNNDNFGARPFTPSLPPSAIRSRAEEYEMDEENRTLRKVWQSRFPTERPMRSWAMGSVQPLQNDNVLVGYGSLLVDEDIEKISWVERLQHPAWTQIREYTKTDPASLVWSLTLLPLTEDTEIGWTIYGGLRIPNWPPQGYVE
ncbi:aryl-sulfate sulfotransferase [bacterium]|nr:aryl-sulfate sulfotransferase [bacterium]